ncbi:hypothetical protein AB1Y20_017078 [Prymnesium parvum]|uniref:Uncharacterized protein n=1 Tax=Prymnesium parvum TaxID=97485 RepID=A0AB34ICA6_PRYPA
MLSLLLDPSSVPLLQRHGTALRHALTPSDVLLLARARDAFHCCWLLPLALYLLTDPQPKLPASISWTIRRGAPRAVHHAAWLLGWLLLARVLLARGDLAVRLFFAQMLATGVIGVILFPLGRSPRADRIHWCASLAYMCDHIVACGLLGVAPPYVRAFCAAFALMAAASLAERALGARRRWVRVAELCFMLGEYGLFISFVCGSERGRP